jgi:hypothetical protein
MSLPQLIDDDDDDLLPAVIHHGSMLLAVVVAMRSIPCYYTLFNTFKVHIGYSNHNSIEHVDKFVNITISVIISIRFNAKE